MKTAIFYLSNDGQTKKIAENLAIEFEHCEIFSLREKKEISTQELAQFDCIIVGASIRYGHFDPLLDSFIRQHCDLLNHKKTAFFSVNLTARKPNRNTPETNVYTRKLLARIAWKPSFVAVFAGALRYPRYGWLDKIMIRFIMTITGGETDTSKEYEYTDWEKVRSFGVEIQKDW